MTTEQEDWLCEHTELFKGEVYRKGDGRRAKLSYAKVTTLLVEAGLGAPVKQDYDTFIDGLRKIQEEEREAKKASLPDVYTVLDFVRLKLAEWQVEVDEKGVWTMGKGVSKVGFSETGFTQMAHLEILEHNRNIPQDDNGKNLLPELPKDKAYISDALFKLDLERKQERYFEARKTLAYVPGPDTQEDLRGWAKALLTTYGLKTHVDASVEAFLHMLWSIKRGLWLKQVDLPFFYTFYSKKQKIGKTRLVQELAKTFSWGYSGNGTLSVIMDPNGFKALTEGTHLLDFQELAIGGQGKSIGKDEIAALKQAITTDLISSRNLYTTTRGVQKNYAVMCSTTNIHVWDIVKDHTGMRRYFEFHLDPDSTAPYLEARELLEYIPEVYTWIDENDDRGFLYEGAPIMKEVTALQEGYVKQEDKITLFLKYVGWEVAPGDEEDMEEVQGQGFVKMKLRNFVHSFRQYLTEQNEDTRYWTTSRVKLALESNDRYPFTMGNGKGGEEDYLWIKK